MYSCPHPLSGAVDFNIFQYPKHTKSRQKKNQIFILCQTMVKTKYTQNNEFFSMLAVFFHSLAFSAYLSSPVPRWRWREAKEQVDSQHRIIVYEINAPQKMGAVSNYRPCVFGCREKHTCFFVVDVVNFYSKKHRNVAELFWCNILWLR